MARECFIEKKFNAKHTQLIQIANHVMSEYAQQGLDLSLRQLYYQMVAHYGLPNHDRNYKMLGTVISDARNAGVLDWSQITDRERRARYLRTWTDPADMMTWSAAQFRMDKWIDQPYYIEVMVEKRALEGVIIPTTDRYNVHFTANKGYSSSSAMHEAGARIEKAIDAGKNVKVIYLGDHDPSGIDMSRDVKARLALYSKCGYWDEVAKEVRVYGDILNRYEVERVALNMDQVEEYNPPPNPAKETDSRSNEYMNLYGDESWELDALEPRVLANLVENAILSVLDVELWNAVVDLEKLNRGYLIDSAREYRSKEGLPVIDEEEDARPED